MSHVFGFKSQLMTKIGANNHGVTKITIVQKFVKVINIFAVRLRI
jgi:hypothetical protein